MAHYAYIEVGTSDFDTICQTCPDGIPGISIEPLEVYLSHLPNKIGSTKVEAALVPDKGMSHSIFWISPDNIQKHGLPTWVKGCNSLDAPHPTVVALLKRRGLPLAIIESRACETMTPQELWDRFELETVGVLKLDTEGMDNRLLTAWIKGSLDRAMQQPLVVWWECNTLSIPIQTAACKGLLSQIGYSFVHQNGTECIAMKEAVAGRTLLRELGIVKRWIG